MRYCLAALLLLLPLTAAAQEVPAAPPATSAPEPDPAPEPESEPEPEPDTATPAEAAAAPAEAAAAPTAAAAAPTAAAAAPTAAAAAPTSGTAGPTAGTAVPTADTAVPTAGTAAPTAATSAPAATSAATPDAEPENSRRDVRRNDVLWLEAGVGYAYVNLVQFTEENFLPTIARTDDQGVSYFGALGFKVSLFAIGGRVTYQTFDAWDIGTAGLDVAIRIPAPIVEPWVRVAFSYAWMGNPADVSDSNGSILLPTDATDVDGFALDVGAGLDIFLAKRFALGVGFEAVMLKMKRKGACGTAGFDCTSVTSVDLTEPGDATGLMLRPHVHLSLHF